MYWIFGAIALVLAGINAQVAKTKFSCDGRTSGYYADVGSGCQVYHMCDGLGRQFSYSCPNATLFQQRMLICDHWYMVNCSKSEGDYGANLRIGQREMPFVDDSESNPYHRTPRPDLLSHPSESELNIIYRTGRAQLGNHLNLVGAESDDRNGSESSSTDEPAYSLPSHWSTEYSARTSTTTEKSKSDYFANKKNVVVAGTIKGKPIIPALNTNTESPFSNFKSQFKATTPVFPRTVDATSPSPKEVGLLPPLPYQVLESAKREEVITTTTQVPVNFESNFKATTPVYPQRVEATSVDPGDSGVLAPLAPGENPKSNELLKNFNQNSNAKIPSLNLDFEAPKIDENFKPGDHPEETPITEPSIFYQLPKFEPDYKELAKKSKNENNQSKRGNNNGLNSQEWSDLRKKFFIPDYDFPLDSASRPSYDSVLSSFQVDPAPTQ